MAVRLKRLSRDFAAKHIPFPAKDSNKYTRGRLLVVGGAAAYPGALCLATEAAYLVGAGYVEAVCAPESLSIVHSYNPNVVARSWEGFSPAASPLSETEKGHPRACLVGSGFDASGKEQERLVLEALESIPSTVVVDGGGIEVLASAEGRRIASLRADKGWPLVTTPHFGEAARLGEPFKMKAPDKPASDHEGDARFAQQLADAYGATVALKGADTFIAASQSRHKGSDDTVYLMDRGTAALAKAGTGDVLAGMVAGLAAQGLSPAKAVKTATLLHAYAGCAAAEELTEVSVCATDVARYIPKVISGLC